MTRAAWTTAALIAALAGCGLDGIGPGTPDAGTADGDAGDDLGDAMQQPTTGLQFTFRSAPDALPTPPHGPHEIEIERATFHLTAVRAVGDAAPGDGRTTIGSVMLDFRLNGLAVSLPEAPPGVYSFLIAEVDRYDIRGTVRLGGDDSEFEIKDEPSMPLTLNIDLEGRSLESGVETIPIKAELRKVVDAVNWQAIQPDDDEIEIGPGYNRIGEVRKKVGEAFKLDR